MYATCCSRQIFLRLVSLYGVIQIEQMNEWMNEWMKERMNDIY
jgi:hypothetical protein